MQPSWTEIGVFWTTVLVAIVTGAATVVNYFLYRSQVSPEVVVYADADERRPSVINLVIENIGKGVAKHVRFGFSEPVPGDAFGFQNPKQAKPMTSGPLITGIPSLGPGSRRVITWGQYGGLHAAIGDRVIKVTARYSGERRTPWDPEETVTESLLDIKSFETTNVVKNDYDKIAAEQLKTIATAIEYFSNGSRSLRVVVENDSGSDGAESEPEKPDATS